MKASKRCPKCDSLRIGHLEEVEDRGPGDGTRHAIVGRARYEGWLGTFKDVGKMEAYVCADCGYFEHHVKDPKSIPFDKLDGFSWLNPESV